MGTMRIGLTGIFVDDPDQAERFYTEVLGFQGKASAPYGPNERWLSVVAPEEPDGVQLVVHLADEPARAFQAAATAAAAAAVTQVEGNLFRQEGEYWTVVFDGSVVRLRDAKGLRYLARLLAHPGREFHAVDLDAAEAQAAPAPPLGSRANGGEPELSVRPDLGDAGVLLDATAKAAYRARLAELRAELEEAEGCNDPARAAKARQEMEFLEGELTRAVGLGGRDRRAASHAERARLNVTRAIRAAIANLARDNPALGRHLAATIRTGRYCAYLPDPRAPIAWERLHGPSAPGLNTGAPGLNAHPADEGSARRRSPGARSRHPWEAAAVLIRLCIEGSQPLSGTAAAEGSEPLRFDGWLELLRVVSELVAAVPSSDEAADAAG
jgi:catechol 2,3-dioxygenase-like lactoylglutathione lyase family enzyme